LQGRTPVEHKAVILLVQQAAAPPVKRWQPYPPQAPQASSQHIVPDSSVTLPVGQVVVEVSSTRHGKVPVEQEVETELVQQAVAPPGRRLQPNPPQLPQVEAQHFKPEPSGILPVGQADVFAVVVATVSSSVGALVDG
jgi:hypothetical protein